jgi:hypothetical protein
LALVTTCTDDLLAAYACCDINGMNVNITARVRRTDKALLFILIKNLLFKMCCKKRGYTNHFSMAAHP